MHYSLIKKSNTSHIAIITVSLLSLIAIVFAMLFFLRAFQLKKALTHLDVSDENSIIRIMKYAGKDSDTVLHIAREYSSNQLYSECARLLLYILQYLDSDCDEALKLLQDCYFKLGADDRFIAAFSNPKFTLSDFEVTSRYAGDAYGFADGIYSEFLGGYAKAKISSICPVSISACENGVYALDLNDRLLKLISRDGSSFSLVFDFKINEFLYFKSTIYYIDVNGLPHGINVPQLNDGEFAKNLRLENEDVICTVFNSDYMPVKELKLN